MQCCSYVWAAARQPQKDACVRACVRACVHLAFEEEAAVLVCGGEGRSNINKQVKDPRAVPPEASLLRP
jgi:hypothetical protein